MNHYLKGMITAGIGTFLCIILVLAAPSPWPKEMTHGVTFSKPYATFLGLDWREAYTAILDDLGVSQVRLVAYWSELEPLPGKYSFADLDYQMDEMAKRDGQVVLAIGRKLPRWPECHVPPWAQNLSEAEQRAKVLDLISILGERYRDHPALWMWQVENEPLFDFGECPPPSSAWLTQEIDRLRQVDAAHPILITDSGELSSWLRTAGYGDMLGTTMYRTVFSGKTNTHFSYDYIFPAWAYRAKTRLVQWVHGSDVLVIELQGEPWGNGLIPDLSAAERNASFSPERFEELHDFARRTQLAPVFWWGAEYWYWEKIQGNDAFWETAQRLLH